MKRPSDLLAMPPDPAFAARLLDWFADVRRDLPWRGGDDLYGTWVSEIMLQQTTVQAVIPFWERFMARFPTVADLAAAPEAEVLAAWSGLGYYSRARNLHAAARRVVADHGGRLPATRDEWLALPGVGPYASGAIASIGLGERVPALDANARRVLARWAVTDPAAWAGAGDTARQRALDELGATLVPEDDPGTWNEAVMELGALVCGARRADCAACPVRGACRAGDGGWPDRVPPPKAVARPTDVAVAFLLVRWRDRVLLVPPGASVLPAATGDRAVTRDDFATLHRGLWGVPATAWWAGVEPVAPAPDWAGHLGLPPSAVPGNGRPEEVGRLRHGITRFRLHGIVYACELSARWEPPSDVIADGAGEQPLRPGFFAPGAGTPPLSRLAEKALQFQQHSGV